MFAFIRKTWNPISGCRHDCCYCWARRVARRLKRVCSRCYNFVPHLHEERLNRFPRSGVVFVSDMGDMWGSWVPDEWIKRVLEAIKPYWEKPDLVWFFETKNPARYLDFADMIPPNSILSTTIETNRDYRVSKAPSIRERYSAMVSSELEMFAKHVSIEPIMDFDVKKLYRMIWDIRPKMVSIGYDNYNCGLPEPEPAKVKQLIDKLKRITVVEVKKDRRGLYRLLS